MKKALLLLIAVLTLTGTVWFNAGASSNGTVSTAVYSEFFTDADAGEKVPAQFYDANSELQELSCVGTEDPGYVSCQFPEEYGGQQVPVALTKNGVMYVSVVDVPSK